MKVRKKAVDVEARQINMANIDQVAKWCGGYVRRREDNFRPSIEIMTLEGIITAQLDDWVIKGVLGEFYSVKPLIFDKTYDVLEE